MTPAFDVFLASKSPRRQELLRQIGVRFQVITLDVPEILKPNEKPQAYVQRLSSAKAIAGYEHYSDRPVLGADTVVVHQGMILEKPKNREDGLRMLMMLSNTVHQVVTGIAMCYEGNVSCQVVESHVHFRAISPDEAARYWETGEPVDKAGGYGIQGMGAVFVEHLSGSYSNVVGLPLMETQQLLAKYRVPVWCGVEHE